MTTTTPEVVNVTSWTNSTSPPEFIATVVEHSIVRYVFPVVVIVGNVPLTVYRA